MKVSARAHLALFQKYRCGTRSRAGPSCSAASGAPAYVTATHALPPVTSASGRLVVYPASETASTYDAGSTPRLTASASSVSTETPSHTVSSLDHFVTQWMLVFTLSCGSASNSSQLQRAVDPLALRSVNSQVVSGVCGVAPAHRTGKSEVSSCPGGSRSAIDPG